MPRIAYDEILGRIDELTLDEQLSLIEQLAVSLRERLAHGEGHDILELRGLGKAIWQDVNAQHYVDQERDSWGE